MPHLLSVFLVEVVLGGVCLLASNRAVFWLRITDPRRAMVVSASLSGALYLAAWFCLRQSAFVGQMQTGFGLLVVCGFLGAAGGRSSNLKR